MPNQNSLFSRTLIVATLLVLGSSISIRGEPGAPYFDSTLDGNWVGSFQSPAVVPAILNLNIQEKDGLGFAWLPKDPTTMSNGFQLLGVDNLRRHNRKIVFDLSASEPEIGAGALTSSYSATLRFKRASDNLTGRLVSADGGVARGSLLLHRASPTVPIQKTWVGSVEVDGIPTSLLLQNIMKQTPSTLEVQTTTKRQEHRSRPTPVAGFGYLGSNFGNLERGRFSGRELTGRLALDSGPLSFRLRLSGQRLAGTFDHRGSSLPVTLTPVATPGRSLRVSGVTPTEAPLGAPVTLRITGKHFSPGIVVHTDIPDVGSGAAAPTNLVRVIEYISADEIRVTIVGDYGAGEGRTIALRIVGPDGQYRDRGRVLRLVNPEVISFENHIQPVFTDSCDQAGCHSNISPAALLNLSAGAAYTNIVRVRSTQMLLFNRIQPRDPVNSYLIRKVKGENITGARMPQGSPPLSDGVLAMFDRWVLEGAKRQ